MNELLAGAAIIGWVVALYAFLRMREVGKEAATWKKIAEDGRRETASWRDEALRAMRASHGQDRRAHGGEDRQREPPAI